jgi:hypothetical protein
MELNAFGQIANSLLLGLLIGLLVVSNLMMARAGSNDAGQPSEVAALLAGAGILWLWPGES